MPLGIEIIADYRIESDILRMAEERKTVLSIVSSCLTFGEQSKSYSEALVNALVQVLLNDFEDNGIIALRLIVDLHKIFRGHLESTVKAIIDFAIGSIENFGASSVKIFGDCLKQGHEYRPKAIMSHKLLMEVPVMVVMLFQLHRKFINDNIVRFLPPVIKVPAAAFYFQALETKPPQQLNWLAATEYSIKAVYSEFVAAKVKILSFFAYISRSFINAVKPYCEILPKIVLELFQSCPLDALTIRKELLIATRHILTTELRANFCGHIDSFLSEEILIGPMRSNVYHFLRPLAYSMMADFIHHVRFDLKPAALIKIVDQNCCALLDTSLPIAIQLMLTKLVLNLLEAALKDDFDLSSRRQIISRVASCFVLKVEVLPDSLASRDGDEGREFELLDQLDISFAALPSSKAADSSNRDATTRDAKYLFKLIITGLKSTAMSARSKDGSPDNVHHQQLLAEQMTRLFYAGIKTLSHLTPMGIQSIDNISASVLLTNTIASDEKEILDHFAYLFSILDGHLFQDIVSGNLEMLFDAILKNIALLALPQYFLAISGISKSFASLLLQFLTKRMALLGESDNVVALVILRLFKLIFLSVSVYPEDNEAVLLPYLSEIIVKCFSLEKNANSPFNYYLLLRSLFRSIGGGRFESLYKEVHQLLPNLLEQFSLALLQPDNSEQQIEIIVELCLTTPVRLSVLLPHLQFLMRPLVIALRSNSDLKTQGMRTLELCIDNLMQEYMEPMIQNVANELVSALLAILRDPNSSGLQLHSALRILGKLGGRARLCDFQLSTSDERDPARDITLVCSTPDFDCEVPLALAFDDLLGTDQRAGRVEVALATYELVLDNFADAVSGIDPSAFLVADGSKEPIVSASIRCHRYALCSPFVKGVLTVFGNRGYWSEIGDRLSDLLRKSIRIATDAYCISVANSSVFSSDDCCSFFVALLEKSLSLPLDDCRKFLSIFFEYSSRMLTLLGSWKRVCELPFLFVIADRFIASAYLTELRKSVNACLGIQSICSIAFEPSWLWLHETRFLKALLFSLKATSHRPHAAEFQLIQGMIFSVIDRATVSDCDESLRTQRMYFSNMLKSFLVSELTTQDIVVAGVVQDCIARYSAAISVPVADLLLPFKERLISPIFAKPLRALPTSLQIGYINAVEYYFSISMTTPILTLNDEILRFVHETLSLADSDDQASTGKAAISSSYYSSLSLKIVALKFLATAITFQDFQQARLQQTRNHIVALFFKSLYSRVDGVVDVARRGLEKIIQNQHKLPKDLMQSGLRPVLTNLTDARRLTVASLDGLCRLLRLLTSYFKPEIGRKMLEHISSWADPQVLRAASDKPLNDFIEINIISGLFAVFPLLPLPANVFIPDVITQLMSIEKFLQRCISSPFRRHIAEYLSNSPRMACEYFWQNIGDSAINRFFSHILRLPEAQCLLAEFASNVERIIECIDVVKPDSVYHLDILFSIFSYVKSQAQPNVTNATLSCWLNLLKRSEPILRKDHSYDRELFQVIQISVLIVRLPGNANLISELVFVLLWICPNFSPVDALKQPIASWIRSLNQKSIKYCLDYWCKVAYNDPSSLNMSFIAISIRMVVLPIFAAVKANYFERDAVPDSFVQHLQEKAWSPRLHLRSLLLAEEIQLMEYILCTKAFSHAAHLRDLIMTTLSDAHVVPDVLSGLPTLFLFNTFPGIRQKLQSTTLPSILRAMFMNFSFDLKAVYVNFLDPFMLEVKNSPTLMSELLQIGKELLNLDGQVSPGLALYWHCLAHVPELVSFSGEQLLYPLVQSFSRAGISVGLTFETNLPFDLFGTVLNVCNFDSAPSQLVSHLLCSGLRLVFSFLDSVRDLRTFFVRARETMGLLSRHLFAFKTEVLLSHFIKHPIAVEGLDETSHAYLLDGQAELISSILVAKSDDMFMSEMHALANVLRPLVSALNPSKFVHWKPVLARYFALHDGAESWVFSLLEEDSAGSLDLLYSQLCLLLCMPLGGCFRQWLPIFTKLLASVQALVGIAGGKPVIIGAAQSTSNNPTDCIVALFNYMRRDPSQTVTHDSLSFVMQLWKSCSEPAVVGSVFELLFQLAVSQLHVDMSISILSSPHAFAVDSSSLNHFDRILAALLDAKSVDVKLLEPMFVRSILRTDGSSLLLPELEKRLPADLGARMCYLLCGQNWHQNNAFWLTVWPLLLGSCFSKFSLDGCDSVEISREAARSILLQASWSQYACGSCFSKVAASMFSKCSQDTRAAISKCIESLLRQTPLAPVDQGYSFAISSILAASLGTPIVKCIGPDYLSYAAASYNCWHTCALILEERVEKLCEYSINELCSIYQSIGEDQLYLALVKSHFPGKETNAICSLMQSSFYLDAQRLIEASNEKSTLGQNRCTREELMIWGDQWLTCARKLQQWDLIEEISRADSDPKSLMIASWHKGEADFSSFGRSLRGFFDSWDGGSDVHDPNFYIMAAYHNFVNAKDDPSNVGKAQECIQKLSGHILNRWNSLPPSFCNAHNVLLAHCQLLVEIQESQVIFVNAASAGGLSRPQALQELKGIFGTWRDRLPNKWEDISFWRDLLTWRQHVYSFVNSYFTSSITDAAPQSSVNSAPGAAPATHPYACRGYHEMAWSINRFAKIARVNDIRDVALAALNKIYSLPNIEVPEAFFKLREQAKCYFDVASDLPTALDVINATNIGFFHTIQKAEFFAMKADVMARLGLVDEANRVFAQAVQIDLNLAKGWSLWGAFNDQRFRQTKDMACASNAVNCYLQAATLLKNLRARKYLSRLLWILSFETLSNDLSASFELYNNDLPAWYWIHFIPYLLSSLARQEAGTAGLILLKLLKQFPQSVFFPLRVALDEYTHSSDGSSKLCQVQLSAAFVPAQSDPKSPRASLKEHLDLIMSSCKSSHPLLCLSLENFAEHVINRLRVSADEDLYRVVSALLFESMQVAC